MDYFPDTQRLFTLGMERMQKLNLLLAIEDPDLIVTALTSSRVYAEGCQRAKPLPHEQSPRRGSFLLLLSVAVGLLAGLKLARMDDASQISLIMSEKTTASSLGPTLLLRSSPSNADVWDLGTGRWLGRTPWTIEARLLPLHVCLQKSGFHDEVLVLSVDFPIRGAVALRSVQSLLKEECDVPIQILE